MHATLAAVQSGGAVAPRFVSHSHPLPLSLEESVELDSILMVLVAMLILVPFCMLSGKPLDGYEHNPDEKLKQYRLRASDSIFIS